ncbi:MAG: M20 family metallopeptidase [Eubacterium sp.]|nr:M20 family metallopeptidase [Eubacterium sp.]MDD7209160.1 M20 family metallopeptidase [Lachnospiraceae bacterium]MDY5498049.1 M20 family metallopeptidase [Anaerobutyricum sp.]
MTQEDIRSRVFEKKEDLIKIYHEFHQIPELGFEEKKTTDLICKILSEMGIVPLRLDPTGVAAYIGPEDGYTIGLRADIDGLPVTEETGISYCSIHAGKMHACGHDGHIAGLLGAAVLLKEMEEELTVRVKMIFQPSEENTKGARHLISRGIIEDVDEIFGLHLFSDIETGHISVEAGPRMAQTDRFCIRFSGKGGHAAKPHQCVDATVMAAEFVMSIQTIVAREIDPVEGAVVTIGSLHSGTQYNVISDRAVLEGTCRSYSEGTASRIQSALRRRAQGMADSYGGMAEIAYEQGSHPPVVNDVPMAERIREQAEIFLPERDFGHIAPLMLGEDFSWYQRKIPGVFAFVGCGKPGQASYPNHHPKFRIDEEALTDTVFLHLSAVFSAMRKYG